MKYFEKGKPESSDFELEGIILNSRIFSIVRDGANFLFSEECDGYFQQEYTEEQAIELLEEAIAWIKGE